MMNKVEGLRLVQEALRLSAHIVRSDPAQLAGQLTGRLLSAEAPAVERLLREAHERRGVV